VRQEAHPGRLAGIERLNRHRLRAWRRRTVGHHHELEPRFDQTIFRRLPFQLGTSGLLDLLGNALNCFSILSESSAKKTNNDCSTERNHEE
jgi:hypothetical protein